MRALLFDIETAPNLGYVWGMWEQNVLSVIEDWHILCFCAKWLEEKKIIAHAQPDFKGFKRDRNDDRELVLKLWKLFDDADILIAHNGDKFDIRKANARFLVHGLPPPSPYRTVDTLKVARKYFKFDSNKLDELGRYLGIGRKVVHTGFSLWRGCMEGNPKAWKQMIRYNRQDVRLLEDVYLKLRPWMASHPNVNVLSEDRSNCPACGSPNIHKRGFMFTRVMKRQRYQCMNCKGWSSGRAEGFKALDIR